MSINIAVIMRSSFPTRVDCFHSNWPIKMSLVYVALVCQSTFLVYSGAWASPLGLAILYRTAVAFMLTVQRTWMITGIILRECWRFCLLVPHISVYGHFCTFTGVPSFRQRKVERAYVYLLRPWWSHAREHVLWEPRSYKTKTLLLEPRRPETRQRFLCIKYIIDQSATTLVAI